MACIVITFLSPCCGAVYVGVPDIWVYVPFCHAHVFVFCLNKKNKSVWCYIIKIFLIWKKNSLKKALEFNHIYHINKKS